MVGVCKVQVKANKVLTGLLIGGSSLWAPSNNAPFKLAAAWCFIKFLFLPESQAYRNVETYNFING